MDRSCSMPRKGLNRKPSSIEPNIASSLMAETDNDKSFHKVARAPQTLQKITQSTMGVQSLGIATTDTLI